MKKQYIVISVLILAFFIACNRPSNPDPPEEQNHSAKDSIKLNDTANNAQQTATIDNTFATKAAIGGMTEVESSANMIKSTENPDVQTLATIMVRDHGTANKELSAIAGKQGIKIPTELPKEKVDLMKKMDTFKEDEKNLYYANLMVKEHLEAVALFTDASKSEANGALKNFAAQKLPILKHHLMEAQNVQKMLKSIQSDKGDKPLKISKDRQ
jgi:putative membrane protein